MYEILEAARNLWRNLVEKPGGETWWRNLHARRSLLRTQIILLKIVVGGRATRYVFDFVNDILFGFATIAGYNKISGSGLIY